jgi:small-conductance mechanosensitive channel
MRDTVKAAGVFVALPWGVFVAAFLYYTLLAMIALGGVSPSLAVVFTVYLAPVVAYGVVLAFRTIAAATFLVRRVPMRSAHFHS